MIFIHKGSKIFYRFFDRKSKVVDVYLHGWANDHKSLLFCKDYTENSALFVDFPPFGKSDKKIENWTIFSYATMVMSLCEHLSIKKVNLIGHSFGGRVAILCATFCKTRVKKLVLVDSAGVKPKRGIKYYFKVLAYKLKRKLRLNTQDCGSEDYRALPENMKVIFKNIVNLHLDEYLASIEAKTLIIFGKNDKTTPLYMARRLNKKIKDSKLVLLNGGHFAFNDDRYTFLNELHKFLKE